jgi:hypothetical protein
MRDHDAGFIPVRYTFLSNIFRTTTSKADFASNKTKKKPAPIFKNKGEKTDSKNYRGIAVLPILLKIIEAILKVDLGNGKFYIQSC